MNSFGSHELFSAFVEWEDYPQHLTTLYKTYKVKFYMTDLRKIRAKHIPKLLHSKYGNCCFKHNGITLWAIHPNDSDDFKSLLPHNSVSTDFALEYIINYIGL
jgi:hypothetical protein